MNQYWKRENKNNRDLYKVGKSIQDRFCVSDDLFANFNEETFRLFIIILFFNWTRILVNQLAVKSRFNKSLHGLSVRCYYLICYYLVCSSKQTVRYWHPFFQFAKEKTDCQNWKAPPPKKKQKTKTKLLCCVIMTLFQLKKSQTSVIGRV